MRKPYRTIRRQPRYANLLMLLFCKFIEFCVFKQFIYFIFIVFILQRNLLHHRRTGTRLVVCLSTSNQTVRRPNNQLQTNLIVHRSNRRTGPYQPSYQPTSDNSGTGLTYPLSGNRIARARASVLARRSTCWRCFDFDLILIFYLFDIAELAIDLV